MINKILKFISNIFKKNKITFLDYHLKGKTSDFIKHIESKGFKRGSEKGTYNGEISSRKCSLSVEGDPYLTTFYLYINALYDKYDLELFTNHLDARYRKLDSRKYKANNCEILIGDRFTQDLTYQVFMIFTIYKGEYLNNNVKNKERLKFLKENKIVIK